MGSAAGARKAAQTIRAQHGVGPDGKSRFHQQIGKSGGGHNKEGYFSRLKREDPAKLTEIATKAGKARQRQVAADKLRYGVHHAKTQRSNKAEG